MTIGVNGFEAVIPRFGYDKNGLPHRVGSSEVCFRLLVELAKIDKKNEYVIYLPCEPTPDLPKESENWKYKVIKNTKFWTIFGLTRALLKKPKLDVFFSPTHYGPLFTPCPEIISILDVSYKHFPELFTAKDKAQLAVWGKYSLAHSKRIITISHSSKDDIIEEYHVAPSKVDVVHLGIKEMANRMSSEESKKIVEKHEVKKPFLLFVGTLQPRKNIARLIEALSLLKDKEVDMVIIGRRGWQFEEILEAPMKFGVTDRVHFLENISDAELPAFYEECELFVMPSLYEGFGLPVLEAMKYGAPVAASDISSLPEAGGNAAIYFNPEDSADIAKKIEKVLDDKNLRPEMIKKGHEQVKKFSWEKAAREVLDVFEEVGGAK